MRLIGTRAFGIRTPIVSRNEDLASLIIKVLSDCIRSGEICLQKNDVLGITESLLAKAQNNFASLKDIAADIYEKSKGREITVVFPIMSRNRFAPILKGIAKASSKVNVLLSYPTDEVGNPIMCMQKFKERKPQGLYHKNEFLALAGKYHHPFTQIDYIDFYETLAPNIEIFFSDDPIDALTLSKDIIVAQIHKRMETIRTLAMESNKHKIYALHDILNQAQDTHGYNPDYGVLGSNISGKEEIKLFPRDASVFAKELQEKIEKEFAVKIHVLIYGDGAFKDPSYGIWELADPVVSPGYTYGLKGRPNEMKLKIIAENDCQDMEDGKKEEIIKKMIQNKKQNTDKEGTTPREYLDLLGTLCDLISGSGDKGTPLVLIQGYFDNYAD